MAVDKIWMLPPPGTPETWFGYGYGMAKAALLGLSRDLAFALAPLHIRCNIIKPACFLMLTLTTSIPATLGLCTAASFPKDLAGFGAGVVLMVVMGLISKSGERKAATKAAAAEKAE